MLAGSDAPILYIILRGFIRPSIDWLEGLEESLWLGNFVQQLLLNCAMIEIFVCGTAVILDYDAFDLQNYLCQSVLQAVYSIKEYLISVSN